MTENAALETTICVLCCEEIDNVVRFQTVGVCNHAGCCSICALRLRQLVGQRTCVVCKTDLPRVICVLHEDEPFESYSNWGDNIGPTHVYDEPSGMFFLHDDYTNHIHALRDPVCKQCGKHCTTVAALRAHVSSVHGLHYCTICLEHKKVFLAELALYTKDALKRHETTGEATQGFRGHPRCDFCRSRFYSTTELYDHVRHHHFECDLCLSHLGIQNRYYRNYNDLENHFRAEHYLCEEAPCLAKKFVVFKSHLDLTAHLRREHPHLKTSRKIDVHFTVKRASSRGESRERAATERPASTISVADFPSLSGSDTATAAATPSFSLWDASPTVSSSRPTVDEFPALPATSSSFRHAVTPPPSAALRAHMDTNGWTYECPALASAAAVLGEHNPLLGVVKPARKHTKGRKKGRGTRRDSVEEKRSVAAAASDDAVADERKETGAGSKSALVLQIRQVLGSDAKYEEFRQACQRFRLRQVDVPVFYAKLRDMFSSTAFVELVLPLLRLAPDKDQVDAVCTYHTHVTKQERKIPQKKHGTTHDATDREQKPPPPRRNAARPPSPAGWGNALKESGVSAAAGRSRPPAVFLANGRARQDEPPTHARASWSGQPPRAAGAPVDAFAGLRLASSPSAPSSGFQSSPSDFPDLPPPAQPLGVQPVTRATWDDQVHAIAQHRGRAAPARGARSKKQTKKTTQSLQDMAMQFKST
ncbi:hypothetical protein PsorP6_014927 [Peronosclerospora sorghi]|uniref:Uncharacterized protein n=1 Tax=Peronosclerospora sorghi TaxID=230839 RepID=A0ACC0VT86_9STRA|nr:hypothetical protein PsorP6_014927 [Peronosclerospora sorghi]